MQRGLPEVSVSGKHSKERKQGVIPDHLSRPEKELHESSSSPTLPPPLWRGGRRKSLPEEIGSGVRSGSVAGSISGASASTGGKTQPTILTLDLAVAVLGWCLGSKVVFRC